MKCTKILKGTVHTRSRSALKLDMRGQHRLVFSSGKVTQPGWGIKIVYSKKCLKS